MSLCRCCSAWRPAGIRKRHTRRTFGGVGRHQPTPSDLLTLGLAALRYPVFRSIVGQRFYQLRKGPGHHAYWWDNTNDLTGSYQGAVGIKTGYTDDAGHCLLFEADQELAGP